MLHTAIFCQATSVCFWSDYKLGSSTFNYTKCLSLTQVKIKIISFAQMLLTCNNYGAQIFTVYCPLKAFDHSVFYLLLCFVLCNFYGANFMLYIMLY